LNSRLTGLLSTASAEAVKLRQTILQKCRLDLYHFFDHEKGQVAIYDAVNPLAEGRRQLAREFEKHDIQVLNPRSVSARRLTQCLDYLHRVLR
jgi:hypothetical protein